MSYRPFVSCDWSGHNSQSFGGSTPKYREVPFLRKYDIAFCAIVALK